MFLFLFVVSLYSPLIQADTPCESDPDSGGLLGFSVTYHIANDAPYLLSICPNGPTGGFTTEVLATLEAVNKSLITHIEQDAVPVPIKADIALLVDETLGKQFDFPTLSLYVKAFRNDKGNVVMDITMPAYKNKFSANTEEERQMTVDFQGIEMHTEMVTSDLWKRVAKQIKQDEEVTVGPDESLVIDLYNAMSFDATLPRLLIESNDDRFYLLLEKLQYEGEYDDKLSPNKLMLTLPTLQIEGNHTLVSLQDMDFKLNANVYSLPIKSALDLKVANIDLTLASVIVDYQPLIKQLWLKTQSSKPTTTLDYTVATKIDHLILPKALIGEALDINYTGNWTFKRIDTETLANFQKTMIELQRKQFLGKLFSEQMVGIVVMGQVMQSLPRLINKSPELSLSDFNVVTKKGKLQGQGILSIDGKKTPNLANPATFFNSLKGNAEFEIDKTLLAYALDAWNSNSDEELPSADEQIQQLLKDKWLVKSGNQLKLQVELAAGKLQVNGIERSIH